MHVLTIQRFAYLKFGVQLRNMRSNNLDSNFLSGFYGVSELGFQCQRENLKISPDHSQKEPLTNPFAFLVILAKILNLICLLQWDLTTSMNRVEHKSKVFQYMYLQFKSLGI